MSTAPRSQRKSAARKHQEAEAAVKSGHLTDHPVDRISSQTTIIVIIAVIVVVYAIHWILLPFVIAGILAFVCTPLIGWCARRTRLPRALFVALVFLVLIGFGALLGFLAVPPLMKEGTHLLGDFHGTIERFAQTVLGDQSVSVLGQKMNAQQLSDAAMNGIQSWLGNAGRIVTLSTYTFASVFGVFLMLVLLFYFLLNGPDIMAGMLWLVPPHQRSIVDRIWIQLDPILKRYLVGIVCVVVYAIIAAYCGLGLILGIPHAVVLALMTGLLEMIPIVGPGAAAVIAGLVAVHYAKGIGPIIAYALYATALRLSIDQLLGPIALGSAARVHPVLVIFCFLAGGSLFGLVGIIMAVPVALAIKVSLATLYDEPLGRGGSRSET